MAGLNQRLHYPADFSIRIKSFILHSNTKKRQSHSNFRTLLHGSARFLTINCMISYILYCPSNSSLGPKSWSGICSSGSKQSPIDISTTAAMYDSSLGDFTLANYANTPAGVNFTASNNGHSLKVSFDSKMYYVSGGGLSGIYTTVQFHLHWGSNNNQGSEHTLDEKMFSAEVCFSMRRWLLCGVNCPFFTLYCERILYV